MAMTLRQHLLMFAVCSLCVHVSYTDHFFQMVGPSQCQDGITNNCTQKCTRDNGTDYECACYPGFIMSNTTFGLCEGEFIM